MSHSKKGAATARTPAAPQVKLPGARGKGREAGDQNGECLKYIDTLFREYLLYRGLTTTLAAFNHELATEPTEGFRPDAVCDLIFGNLIPAGDLQGLLRIMDFLKSRFYSRLDAQHRSSIQQMDTSLLRLYVSTHWQAGSSDLVSQFFSQRGEALLKGPDAESWRSWFALTHVDSVAREPDMIAFFTPEWAELVEVSFRNFLEQVFATMPQPAVLRFNALRQMRKELQKRNEILEADNATLRGILESADRAADAGSQPPDSAATAQGVGGEEPQATGSPPRHPVAEQGPAASRLAEAEHQGPAEAEPVRETRVTYSHEIDSLQAHQAITSVCRFSPSGEHVASGAADGTVRIWAPRELGGGEMGGRREATFQAGGPVLSLDWDRRANKVMLVGTSAAGVKAWHLNTLRFTGEYGVPKGDPMAHVLAITASPTEQVFAASMATSAAPGWQAAGRLMLFNFRTFQKTGTLAMEPVAGAPPSSMELAGIAGEDLAVTGLDFSPDGRLLAAACSDGCVRIFDVRAGRCQVQVRGWVAGSGGGSCAALRFAAGGGALFTLSGDGALEEWSLAAAAKPGAAAVSTFDTREYCVTTLGGAPQQQAPAPLRHHFAASGSPGAEQSVALTSNDARLPMLARTPGTGWYFQTLPMTLGGCVSAVDLHPFRPIAACGTDSGSVSIHRTDLSETL